MLTIGVTQSRCLPDPERPGQRRTSFTDMFDPANVTYEYEDCDHTVFGHGKGGLAWAQCVFDARFERCTACGTLRKVEQQQPVEEDAAKQDQDEQVVIKKSPEELIDMLVLEIRNILTIRNEIYFNTTRLIDEEDEDYESAYWAASDHSNRMGSNIAHAEKLAAALKRWISSLQFEDNDAAATHTQAKVVIEVLGGVAEITSCPDNIDVEIIDHDNGINGEDDTQDQ